MFAPNLSWLATLVLAALVAAASPPAATESALASAPDRDVVPVLLVPGWGDQAMDMAAMRHRLVAEGWPESHIAALSFRNPVGSNEGHSGELAVAVRNLQGLTGAERIDIIAHSMGGLSVRHFLRSDETAAAVRRVVFLGTPHRGTVAAVLAWGDGGREMLPGSDFLSRLNENRGMPDGIEALSVRTPVDLRVIPASSAKLEGARVENLEVCCPTHGGLMDDERTVVEVVRFLRDGPAGAGGADLRLWGERAWPTRGGAGSR